MGDPGSEIKRGLRTLEDVEQVSIVCAADLLIEPSAAVQYKPLPQVIPDPCLPGALNASASKTVPLPVEASPQLSITDVFHVQQAMILNYHAMRYRGALLDPADFGLTRRSI